ncbi:MAG: sulfur oxidation c-type cytochrome SoxX [gamma proteobacterium endosymbiont of Lamellibrachia anaximandri]|nr:sulfur oxidation c-type cytochrome SoxX [gamma proteobacterium endosymbiont of Lamellibrachia anaximandri]MBL3535323.1 sulfur oxidation c-type cytochrome SoxX [gamma proteobacterium endosymbiont of Lamellibrachia anaximandri]MBL3600989.1 sulfur oxidation c-type cytochrome SoxX [gamma proteobacterium endosymbiont of Lamellibrachia anaximandri]
MASAGVLLAGQLALAPVASAAGPSMTEEGKKLAFSRKKGNCLACHAIAGGQAAGNIAPPLGAMQSRFKNKAELKAQIMDATVKNPESSMPPFGRHKILSGAEIDKVVEFVWSL